MSVNDICNWVVPSSFTAGWNWMKQMKQSKMVSLALFTQMCFQPFQLVAEAWLKVQRQHVFWTCHSESVQLRGDEVNPEYLPTISAWWASVSC